MLRRTRPARPVATAAGVLLLAAAALGACRGGGGEADGLRLVARDFAFDPTTIEVVGGSQATVEATNTGSVVHNISVEGSEIDLDLRPGESVNLIFVPSGDRLPFRCKYHPGRMAGTFVVR